MSHFSLSSPERVGGERAFCAEDSDLMRRACGSAGVAKLLRCVRWHWEIVRLTRGSPLHRLDDFRS